MSDAQSAWLGAGCKFLSDGQWHPGYDLYERVYRAVPHPMARDFAERERERSRLVREARGADTRHRELTTAALVLSGQRGIAQRAVNQAVKRGHYEVDGVIPRGEPRWREGADWKIRDIGCRRMTLRQLHEHLHLSDEYLRQILAELQVPLIPIGKGRNKAVDLDYLPALEQAAKAHHDKSQVDKDREAGFISIGALCHEVHVSKEPITEIVLALGIRWTNVGRKRLLTLQDAEWVKAVLPAYHAEVRARRAAGRDNPPREPRSAREYLRDALTVGGHGATGGSEDEQHP